jgi:hypothetical protein
MSKSSFSTCWQSIRGTSKTSRLLERFETLIGFKSALMATGPTLPGADRPTWHYQLGATLTMGDRANYHVPETPGPCPASANLDTKDLYISQAVELCRRVMADSNSLTSDRAIALC